MSHMAPRIDLPDLDGEEVENKKHMDMERTTGRSSLNSLLEKRQHHGSSKYLSFSIEQRRVVTAYS